MTGRVPERYTQNPRGNAEQIAEVKSCTEGKLRNANRPATRDKLPRVAIKITLRQ